MTKQEIIKQFKQVLREYFSPDGENKKFFDSSQIPRICSDIAGIRKSIEALEIRAIKKEDDYEVRIRKLETNMWRNAGMASVLGALGIWALQKFI